MASSDKNTLVFYTGRKKVISMSAPVTFRWVVFAELHSAVAAVSLEDGVPSMCTWFCGWKAH